MNKIKAFLLNVKHNWNTPPKGRYINYKEIVSLSAGGFGVKLVHWCVNQMIISVGNTLIGNTIGINPTALYIIYLLSIASSVPLTAIRAKMIDNSRSMKGKYRPYILSMGIPTAVLGIGFVLMPYDGMSLFWKCFTVLIFNVGFQFFYNFYFDAYQSIINVLSPDTIERSDVQSVRSVVENFAPSVANVFMPLIAKAITGENTLYDMRVFRVLFPIILIVGVLISILIYVNNEEKIVQAKSHIIQIKFVDALKSVAKNKYFWLISLAGWLGFLESSMASILGWMYNYQHVCSPAEYSIIVAITGNASLWSMIFAPFLIRKFGKRKTLVVSNMLNVLFIFLMLPIIKQTGKSGMVWLFVFVIFINQLFTTISNLLIVGINADIRDYQQYITGERIDGMFATVALIGTVITLATSSVLPAIYEKAGLNKAVALSLGYDGSNVYDVLYNQEYFIHISYVLIVASVVGALLNAIPFFFYDLTETKQKAMVNVLKIRAMFEDYGNNIIEYDKIKEVVEIINEAREFADKEKVDIKSVNFNGVGRKEARRLKKKIISDNEKTEIAKIVLDELNRFESETGIAEVENAQAICSAGLNGFFDIPLASKKEIKALPKKSELEINYRRNMFMLAGKMKTAKKTYQKYFPDGIEEFDNSIFEKLFKTQDDIEAKRHSVLRDMKLAKENKDLLKLSQLKSELKKLTSQKKEIEKTIKDAMDKNTIYYRATRPYLDAKRILIQKENYSHLDDLFDFYEKQTAELSGKLENSVNAD